MLCHTPYSHGGTDGDSPNSHNYHINKGLMYTDTDTDTNIHRVDKKKTQSRSATSYTHAHIDAHTHTQSQACKHTHRHILPSTVLSKQQHDMPRWKSASQNYAIIKRSLGNIP